MTDRPFATPTGEERDGLRIVGRDHALSDAVLKVTGGLAYGDDLSLPGMVHAKLVLSPVAHARVTAVDTSLAEALPGVIGVFTHRDAPDAVFSRYRILPGQAQCPMDEPLFTDTARFVGDRLAAVVADTPQAAAEAARLVRFEFEELPPVLSPEQGLADGAPRVHDGGNLLHEFVHETGQAPPPAGTLTVTTSVRTPRVHHAALEPHLCLARADESGKLTIWSPTQSVFGARTVVADLFGLPYTKVRVVKIPMGGSFGGKQEFILEPVTAFLALRSGRPVKLVLEREEAIFATMVRPATASTVSLAVERDGALADVDVDCVLDAGAYATSSLDYAEMMSHKVGRLYRTPHYRHRGRVVYTTTPVAGGARAYGAPEILTAVEIAMDQVARRLDLDPLDLRLRNVVEPFAVEPLTGMDLGDARVRECLERGAEAFGWRERRAAPADDGRYLTGVGLACAAHKNGILSDSFSDFCTMAARMNEDASVALSASLHEMGAGCLTLMQLIVAEELGISPDMVSVTEGDSDVTPYDFGCFGSRVTYVCGAGAKATADALRARLVELAAVLLEQARTRARGGLRRGAQPRGRRRRPVVRRGRPGGEDPARRRRVRAPHAHGAQQPRLVLRAVRGGERRCGHGPHAGHRPPGGRRHRPRPQPGDGSRSVPGRRADGHRLRALRGGAAGRPRPSRAPADSRTTTSSTPRTCPKCGCCSSSTTAMTDPTAPRASARSPPSPPRPPS